MDPQVLNYSVSDQRRRRAWLPVVLIFCAAAVWHWPRLTPTMFPNILDQSMLGVLLLGALCIGYFCQLPAWVVGGYGALGMWLFLIANFNDNNFRANYTAAELMLPWSIAVAGGAVSAWLAALAGRIIRSKISIWGPRPS
jgi:hypothetical protein